MRIRRSTSKVACKGTATSATVPRLGKRTEPSLLLALVAVAGILAGIASATSCRRGEETSPRQEKPADLVRRPVASPEPPAAPSQPARLPPEPDAVPAEPDALPPEPAAPPARPTVDPQFSEEGLKEEGLDVARHLVEDFPDSTDALGVMGNMYMALGRTTEALRCWERSVELDPNAVDGYRCMAENALQKGDFETAEAIARRALKTDPTMPAIHGQLGRALIGLGRPQEAVSSLAEDIKISPKASVSYFLLGQAHQQLKQYLQAKNSYMTALQIDPSYTEACYGIAQVCARLGQEEEAAKYRKKFTELKAQDWRNLPDTRDHIFARTLAVAWRRRAAQAHTDAGLIYSDHGRWQTAEKHWRRAETLDPRNIQCREELVAFYQQEDRNEEALRVCEHLRRIAPRNPEYHFGSGVLLARMNRIEAALSAVKRATELDPGNADYLDIYEQIRERK